MTDLPGHGRQVSLGEADHADGPERHARSLAHGADVDGRLPEAPERQAHGGGDVLDRPERLVSGEAPARGIGGETGQPLVKQVFGARAPARLQQPELEELAQSRPDLRQRHARHHEPRHADQRLDRGADRAQVADQALEVARLARQPGALRIVGGVACALELPVEAPLHIAHPGHPLEGPVRMRRIAADRAERPGEVRAPPCERCLAPAGMARSEGSTAASRSALKWPRSARTTASVRAPVAVPPKGSPPATCTGNVPSGHGSRLRRSTRSPASGSIAGASTAMSSSGVPSRTCRATQSAAASSSDSSPACSSMSTVPSGPALLERASSASTAGGSKRYEVRMARSVSPERGTVAASSAAAAASPKRAEIAGVVRAARARRKEPDGHPWDRAQESGLRGRCPRLP